VSQVIGAASHKIKSSLFFLRTERTSRFLLSSKSCVG